MAEEKETSPKTVSSDYRAMAPFWKMVDAILHGAEAMRAVSGSMGVSSVAGPVVPYASLAQLNSPRRGRNGAQSMFLPQFPQESNADYDMRRQNAPFTNLYADISRNLSSKPFSKTLELDPDSDPQLIALEDDVDGQGNSLHVFCADLFKSGIDKGVSWILIDYDNVLGTPTLAEERALGLRPYWVHIPAERVIAVYSDFVLGHEVFTHVRLYENRTKRDGFSEVSVERVRIFNREPLIDKNGKTVDYGPPTWELWELISSIDVASKEKQAWKKVEEGQLTIAIIPIIPFRTGKREGSSWRIIPPLKDLVHMQIEEFQQESNLKTIKELTAFPMLAGNGVEPGKDAKGVEIVVPVGPRAVLYAPAGSWAFIEPGASSMTFLQQDLEKLRTEMRDLGMQPLTSANMTVITTANLSIKAHSAVQAWCLGLKDALEQAMYITGLWLNVPDINAIVKVHTDFGAGIDSRTEPGVLLQAEAVGILSKETVQEEFKRRGIISDDFDPETEAERLEEQRQEASQRMAEQQALLQPEQPIDPASGKPIAAAPQKGQPPRRPPPFQPKALQ